MLTRRGLIAETMAGGAALIRQASAAVLPPSGVLRFEVLRNDRRLGEHVIRLTQDSTTMRAAINVEIAVGLGPITLYRYTHNVQEEWRDGIFMRMESETNDDGTRHSVRAERTTEGVAVRTGDGKRMVMPPATIPLTHWNDKCMSALLLNPQTGDQVRPQVRLLGEGNIPLANGRIVRARRYALTGEIALDDWYDEARSWVALDCIGRDGSTIAYRRAT